LAQSIGVGDLRGTEGGTIRQTFPNFRFYWRVTTAAAR